MRKVDGSTVYETEVDQALSRGKHSHPPTNYPTGTHRDNSDDSDGSLSDASNSGGSSHHVAQQRSGQRPRSSSSTPPSLEGTIEAQSNTSSRFLQGTFRDVSSAQDSLPEPMRFQSNSMRLQDGSIHRYGTDSNGEGGIGSEREDMRYHDSAAPHHSFAPPHQQHHQQHGMREPLPRWPPAPSKPTAHLIPSALLSAQPMPESTTDGREGQGEGSELRTHGPSRTSALRFDTRAPHQPQRPHRSSPPWGIRSGGSSNESRRVFAPSHTGMSSAIDTNSGAGAHSNTSAHSSQPPPLTTRAVRGGVESKAPSPSKKQGTAVSKKRQKVRCV